MLLHMQVPARHSSVHLCRCQHDHSAQGANTLSVLVDFPSTAAIASLFCSSAGACTDTDVCIFFVGSSMITVHGQQGPDNAYIMRINNGVRNHHQGLLCLQVPAQTQTFVSSLWVPA